MNHQGQVTVRFLRPIFDSDLEAYRPTPAQAPGLGTVPGSGLGLGHGLTQGKGLAPGPGQGLAPGQGQGTGPGQRRGQESGQGCGEGEGLGWERRAMARLVRRRMLLALKYAPATAGAPLTRSQVTYLTLPPHTVS